MNKTKAQLRAEAVERLRKLNCMDVDCYQLLEATVDDAGEKVGYRVEISKLIEMLTDDAHEARGSYEERLYDVPVSDCPYCGCKRVVIHDFSDIYENPHSYRVEHVDEKEAFEAGCFESYYSFDSAEKAVEHANMHTLSIDDGTPSNTNGTCPDADGTASNAPEGDAVKELREFIDDQFVSGKAAWTQGMAIADMVERDYVSREVFEDLRDEFTWETTFLHRIGKKCGTEDVPSLVAYVDKLESRVEELEAVDRRIAETDSRWEAAIRDLERMTDERDELQRQLGTVFAPSGKLDAQARAEIEDAERSANAAESRGDDERAVLSADTDTDKGENAETTETEPNLFGDLFAILKESKKISLENAEIFDNQSELGHDAENYSPDSREKFESGMDKDAKVTQDSREKLETDMRAWKDSVYSFSDDELYAKVTEWLDRQAAITRAEFDKPNWDYCESCEQFKAMQDRIDELEAALKGERNNFYQAMESCKHWQREYENLKATSYSAEAPSDESELARELGKALAERDMYREKLGRAVDAAHEIVRMMEVER